MKIAAFDTSSGSGSIAIMDGDSLVGETIAGRVGAHSEWLMRSFHGLVKDAGISVRDIGLFAVAVGPGSFTGLRIGVSAVKGLAWAAEKKVVAVSTLEALAMNLRYTDVRVCPMLDARKGEVYAALYSFTEGGLTVIVKESVMTPDVLFKTVEEAGSGAPVAFLGNGVEVYLEAIRKGVKKNVITSAPLWNIRASNVGLLAFERADTAIDPASLTPVYLRRGVLPPLSEAEIKGGSERS
ncbi:MAG: tRNA (adenosine(37)-N6)-threonylcarbamoyltransferase complex dimerization subunit type 1 TsaB [Deltaproteobacteria bacterium]|nr:tRNA (adenosine(37)-N6)-threonylcarbamoyltransferase complex dimerization subunit type 1 TsaB [Deltaproteobacteria bacterium]